MFESIKKIALFMGFVSICCLATFASASTQKIDLEEPTSAAKFARDRGGENLATMLDKESNQIVCGRSDNVCRPEEMCLKAYGEGKPYDESSLFGTGRGTKGFCVPKEDNPVVWSIPERKIKNRPECFGVSDGSADEAHIAAAKKYGMTTYTDTTTCCISPCYSSNCCYPMTVEVAPIYVELMEHSFIETDQDFWGDVKEKNDECFTDTQTNKKICPRIIGNEVTLEYGQDGAFEGCEVLPVKVYNMQGCFFCPLAKLIFKTANNVTAAAFNTFAHSFKVLISIIFAIWLALAALQQVFAFTKQDAPKFLAAIVRQGFKFMLAFFLLTYSGNLFSYFISPLLQSGLALGEHIQSIDAKNFSQKASENNDKAPPSDENRNPMADSENKKNDVQISNDYFNIKMSGDRGLYDHIETFLTTLQGQLAYMQAIGTTLFCVGSHSIITINWNHLIAGMRMMILGGIIVAFAFLLTIAFAFYFLDAVLQLAIVGAMLPLMIAGWPFKATAQYAGVGFKMLLNTFFVFFFTGFVVSVNVVLIDQALALSQNSNLIEMQKNEKETEEEKTARETAEKLRQETSQGFEAIAKAMNEQNIETLRTATDIGGTGFILLLFSCVFGFKFVQEVPKLANKLCAGGIKGVASKIGTMGASTVKGMATKAAQPLGKAIADKYHETGGIIGMAGGLVGGTGGLVQAAGERLQKTGKLGKFAGTLVAGTGKIVGKTGGGVRSFSKKAHKPFRSK